MTDIVEETTKELGYHPIPPFSRREVDAIIKIAKREKVEYNEQALRMMQHKDEDPRLEAELDQRR